MKSIMRRRPTGKTQKYQIASLSKRVTRNTRFIADINYSRYFKITGDVPLDTALGRPYVIPLMDVSQFTPIFGGPAVGTVPGWNTPKVHFTYLTLDMQINMGNEINPITFTCFLASPANEKVVNRCGGGAAASCGGLTEDTDYINQLGLAMLNPKTWRVHKTFRIKTRPMATRLNTSPPLPPPAPATVNQMFDFTSGRRHIGHKLSIRINDRSPLGAWNSMNPWDIKASGRVHLILLSNNNPVDGGHPRLKYIAKVNGTTSAR